MKEQEYKQFKFDCMSHDPYFLKRELADREKGHPKIVMKNIGFNYVKAVPQSIADCWFFLCDAWPSEYPTEYIEEIYDYPFDRF